MMDTKIKVIIFDFDETMYYSANIKTYYVEYIKNTLRTLTDLPDETIIELMEKYGFMSSGETRIGFGKNCHKFGVTPEQWNSYRIDNFFQIDYENAEIIDNAVYKKLAEKYKLYIVSNEVYENIVYKGEKLNIDLTPFIIRAPYKSEVLNNKFTKQDVMEQIIKENNISPAEAMVFGDRYNVDILPMENLGGSGVLVKHPREIEQYAKENLL